MGDRVVFLSRKHSTSWRNVRIVQVRWLDKKVIPVLQCTEKQADMPRHVEIKPKESFEEAHFYTEGGKNYLPAFVGPWT